MHSKNFPKLSGPYLGQKPPGITPEILRRASQGIFFLRLRTIGTPINSEYDEYYVSLSNEGTLYFASNRPGGHGSFDIYRSPFANGQHTTPENLGPAINTEYLEQDPFIALDESYLIFTVADGTDGFGKGDMYISFRKEDSTWTKAKNMGNVLNSDSFDFCPIVSPDGKYFFFTRGGDIYWVASVIIEALRPKN